MRELCSAPFGRGFLLGPSQKGISSGSFAPEHSLVSSAPFYSLVRSTPSYSRHSPPFFAPCRHRSGHIPPCVPHFTRCSTASALRAVTFLCPLHNGPRAGQSVAIGTSNCTTYLISVRLLRLWAIQTSTLYINAAIGNEAANKPATVSGMTRGLLPHPMIRGTTVGRLAGS